jgi:pimeloyl-ACP methyl ester carboxylesterase
MTEPKNLVLVHGAWHGPWCWELLTPELEERAWTVTTVDLPSTSGDPAAGMHADARAVREHLAKIDGPVTLLAHSYGGIPSTEAAGEAQNVARIIYLAAHLLKPGESLVTPLGGAWFPPETGFVPGAEPLETLFHDVPADRAREAAARLRPQSAKAFTEELTRTARREIPSAFIVCDDDRAMPEPIVKRAITERMTTVVRHLPGSHSPFLSRPAELAELIDEVTAALPPAR